ncbi:hypothetical protein [Streptomyces albireticuli]|uniref:hypothetical protein n=1 Tax=Streptomyces albireticuli TaxID=1940 RepID=UPI003B8A5FBE
MSTAHSTSSEKGQDVADQLQELRFVVQDPPRQKAFSCRGDHHAVVVFLDRPGPAPET